jgi:hypothetical protein
LVLPGGGFRRRPWEIGLITGYLPGPSSAERPAVVDWVNFATASRAPSRLAAITLKFSGIGSLTLAAASAAFLLNTRRPFRDIHRPKIV